MKTIIEKINESFEVNEAFFDNIADKDIQFVKLGFNPVGDYNGRTCYLGKIQGGDIFLNAEEYEFDRVYYAKEIFIFIAPNYDTEYGDPSNYHVSLIFHVKSEDSYVMLHTNVSDLKRFRLPWQKLVSLASGNSRLKELTNPKTAIGAWGDIEDIFADCATIPEFNEVNINTRIINTINNVFNLLKQA